MSVVLHDVELGGHGRPPLLLLHGLLGSARNWKTAGRDLTGRFHVFALDARNHGRSPHDPEMNYEAMAGDVLAWMDAHEMERATLVGHSMGGKTAMLLACRHPARVERLVVVDIAPKDYRWVEHRREFAALNDLDLVTLKSRADAEEQFAPRVPGEAMRKFLVTNLERSNDGHWRWLINLPVLTAALSDLERNCLPPSAQFAGPALFIAGGRSSYVLGADHDEIKRHFPAAQIVSIADSGHNPHMEKRSEFVQLVLEGIPPQT